MSLLQMEQRRGRLIKREYAIDNRSDISRLNRLDDLTKLLAIRPDEKE